MTPLGTLQAVTLTCMSLLTLAQALALRPALARPLLAESQQPFDKQLATALAGYAFDVYNDPPVGKVSRGSDGTEVRFTSADYVGRIFSGVLMVTLRRGELNEIRGGEDGFVERLLTGDKADPYVELSCIEAAVAGAAGSRPYAVDSAMSSVRRSTTRPVWNETLFLYVSDPQRTHLEVRMMDRDTFKEDDFIGRAVVPLSPLAEGKAIALPLPLYIDDPNDPRNAAATAAANTNSSAGGGSILSGLRRFFVNSRPRRLRTGTVFADMEYIAFNTSSAPAAPVRRRLPAGATLGVDWAALLAGAAAQRQQGLGSSALQSRQRLLTKGFDRVCSIESDATDTQVGVWADRKSRAIIVSFRGTETVKFKDILTDINLLQTPFLESEPSLRRALVHSGFLSAYRSIAPALVQLLERLLLLPVEPGYSEEGSGWVVYITGHSLGGALATLLAFDLFRVAGGLLAAPIDGMTSSYDDPFHRSRSDSPLAVQVGRMDVHLCTFGAPRVGCPQFKAMFDSLQRGRCYRVVNSDDIVARVPRGSAVNRLLSYEHVGKTVMIGSADGSSSDGGACWVEGESEGQCPVTDSSPFAASPDLPPSGVAEALQMLGIGSEGAAQLMAALSFATDVSKGLEGSFLRREAAIARSLVDGRALESHLEPAYYAAFERLLQMAGAEDRGQS